MISINGLTQLTLPLQTQLSESTMSGAPPSTNTILSAELLSGVSDGSNWLSLRARAPFLRRFAAASLYDYIFCLWIATFLVVACRLLLGADGLRLTAHAPIQLFTVLLYLFRDSFCGGRTFTKSLLGLAVIDRNSGRPARASQSLLRNLLLLAPYFLFQATAMLYEVKFFQNSLSFTPTVGPDLLNVLSTFGITYVAILLLVESFLMTQGDGLRLADRLTGTQVVRRTNENCAPI